MTRLMIVVAIFGLFLLYTPSTVVAADMHGGVTMGASSVCDNGTFNIQLDWGETVIPDLKKFMCYGTARLRAPVIKTKSVEACFKLRDPLHICMNKAITYSQEDPPTSGPHRPAWPKYGEYYYLPTQRWLHSLEHGAAVFLYNPCVDTAQLTQFTSLARSCLRRHIITPYALPPETPFAVVTWGCRLMISSVDANEIRSYLRKHAIKDAPEKVSADGQYSFWLRQAATIISDINDAVICPP